MNQDTLAGDWKQLKGKVRQRWGKLTNDDLDVIAGKRDELIGKIQEKYGEAREEVERQVRELEDSHDSKWDDEDTDSGMPGGTEPVR